MPARSSKTCNPKNALTKLQTIPEQLFQLPSELVWKRTFLDSCKDTVFRSNSAPAVLQSSTSRGNDSLLEASLGEGDSTKASDGEKGAPVDRDSFCVGDIVAATADFCIGGELAVEKGCRGTVMCHGERPDGSMGISIQFEKWKTGRAANVFCQPHEIQVVVKAPSVESFGIGDIVTATSDFCIGGVLTVEKGCRGKVICHGERPDGSKGVSIAFEARKDGSDAHVLCLPYQIQTVHCAQRAQKYAQAVRRCVASLEQRLELAWASIQSFISFVDCTRSSLMQSVYRNFASSSFSLGPWAWTSIIVAIVAICCVALLPSVPVTERVIVEDNEVYSRAVGRTLLNQCVPFTRNYLKIRSKKNITVCGTQTKVILFLRNKCEVYSYYQHEIGTCNVTEASSSCVTASPASETGVRWHGQAQSYRIERCSSVAGIGFEDALWQRLSAFDFMSVHRFVPCFFAGSVCAVLREMGLLESFVTCKRMLWRRILHVFGTWPNDE